jgi:hypothetical protein
MLIINLWLFQILKYKISLLEASNAELQRELQDRRVTCEHLTQRALDAQVLSNFFFQWLKDVMISYAH